MTSPAMEEATKLATYWREEGDFLDVAYGAGDEITVGYATKSRETADTLEALLSLLGEAEKALEPFATEFNKKRDNYSKRYGDKRELGYHNFDKMPGHWPWENALFFMAEFRAADATLTLLREASK